MNKIDTKLYPQYDFRFSGVENTFNKYTLDKDANGRVVAVERINGTVITDDLIIDRVKFSIAWVCATMHSHSRETLDTTTVTDRDYEYAFSENARKTYATIMACVQKQLQTAGNIDPLEVVEDASLVDYKYSREYAKNLFSKRKFVEATEMWVRRAITDAKPKTQPTMTYDEALIKQCQEENKTL